MCTKNLQLYSYAGVFENGTFYNLQDPGDDKFDVKVNASDGVLHGTCTDIRYDYMRSGCPTPESSAPIMSLVGCTGR